MSAPDGLTVYLDDEEVAGTTFDGLAAGNYTVLVTEGSFCSALVTFTVNEGTSLNVVTQTTDLLCFGVASGVIDATVSNGLAPFAFELTGAASASNANGLFDGLTGGAYVLEVTDSNGCTGIVDLELEEPAALFLEATITDASAPGTGAIDLTIAGGTAPYNVTWTQDGAFVMNTEDLDGLDGPSSFEVVVVDDNSCEIGGPYAVSDAQRVRFAIDGVPSDAQPCNRRPAIAMAQLDGASRTPNLRRFGTDHVATSSTYATVLDDGCVGLGSWDLPRSAVFQLKCGPRFTGDPAMIG